MGERSEKRGAGDSDATASECGAATARSRWIAFAPLCPPTAVRRGALEMPQFRGGSQGVHMDT